MPWQEATAICLADVAWLDGTDVLASPRQILRRQLARLAERGWSANAGTELEFMVFLDTYEEAWQKGYRELRPANLYNVDYSLLGTARVEPLIRRIRNSMAAAGMSVEDSKGECNFGQHEINFRYADALRTADEHVIFKNGAKEIAADEGVAITFMAKYDEREGSSCHIHFSLADEQGPLFERDRALFESFLAGQLTCLREMTLLLAPNVNSYKRYAAGSFAPTTVAWGHDNRTCSLRVVGHGALAALREPRGRRRPEPLPGAQRDRRVGAARCRGGARAGAGARGQRLRRPRSPARPRRAARRPRAVRRAAPWPARPSGRRSSTTTSTPPTSSWRRSARPSPTGSASGGSSVYEAWEQREPQIRKQRRPEIREQRKPWRVPLTAGARAGTLAPPEAVFAPVRSQTAFEETVDRLGTAIKLGLLAPGSRLPAERELCARWASPARRCARP